jgi:hypothetical protein
MIGIWVDMLIFEFIRHNRLEYNYIEFMQFVSMIGKLHMSW